MDQLFRALPTDLQWEVLTEFTGTHTVRKGKLRRKLALGNEYQMIKDMNRIQNIVEPYYSINYVHATSFVKLTNGRQITCYQGPNGKDTYYMFVSSRHDPTRAYHCGKIITNVLSPENSVDLPPYEKHVYLSYEHTDKKKKKKL